MTDPAVVHVETLAGDIYLEQRSDVNRGGSVEVRAGRPRPGPREGLSPPPDS